VLPCVAKKVPGASGPLGEVGGESRSTHLESRHCVSVLQCVAVHCSALQSIIVCCSVLQRVAHLVIVSGCCRVLQCVAVRCSLL